MTRYLTIYLGAGLLTFAVLWGTPKAPPRDWWSDPVAWLLVLCVIVFWPFVWVLMMVKARMG